VAGTKQGRMVMVECGSPIAWKVDKEGWFVRPLDVAIETTCPTKDRAFVTDRLPSKALVFKCRP
jgi:hypothetical protein